MRVIGFEGPAQVGKDTCARIVQDFYPGKVKIQGWSWLLKLSAFRCFRPEATMEEAVAWADDFKLNGAAGMSETEAWTNATMTGRVFLQRYGTEAHRDVFGDDFWIDALLPRWVTAQPPEHDCDLLLIPDTRFDNEAERIHAYGGQVFRVHRPGYEPVNDHASDAGVSPRLITSVIYNTNGFPELEQRLRIEILA